MTGRRNPTESSCLFGTKEREQALWQSLLSGPVVFFLKGFCIKKGLFLSNKMIICQATEKICCHSKQIIASNMKSAEQKKEALFHFLLWAVCFVHAIILQLLQLITTEFASESRILHNLPYTAPMRTA